MKKKFYITTPIYYVNDKPHLGSAYTTVNADVLHRYHRWLGFDSLFLTGLDEHGQKVQKAALEAGLEPQQHCDQMAEHFKSTWQQLNIDYDIFFRTTHPRHKQAVQQCLQQLYDKGDIFESTYEGWYCVSDETFHTHKELVDGLSPTGRKVEKIVEKNYFFKMSSYQKRLIDFYTQQPEAVQPAYRRNEVLGFLKQPLQDLCISRPKSRLQWGIELPFDSNYVTYVWFDALLNYATAIDLQSALQSPSAGSSATGKGDGLQTVLKPDLNDSPQPQSKNNQAHHKNPAEAVATASALQSTRQKTIVDSQFIERSFQAWWPAAHNLVGKDILITHAVYWPCMLMALGVEPAKVVFAHGWLLNKQNEKMSKSRGDIMKPEVLVSLIGVDALRYYLVKNIMFGQDAPISTDLVLDCVNHDLANTLGNLLSRVTRLVHKYFEGQAPKFQYDVSEFVGATDGDGATDDVGVKHGDGDGAMNGNVDVDGNGNGNGNGNGGSVIARAQHQAASRLQNQLGACPDPAEIHIYKQALALPRRVEKHILKLEPHLALAQVLELLNLANPYLENQAPWKLVRTDKVAAGHVLATVLELLRIAALLLQPVMPEKTAQLLQRLSVTDCSFQAATQWGQIKAGTPILEGPPLFPRVQR